MDSPVDAWLEHTNERDRIRMVVAILDEPTTVDRIAERADVSYETAENESERLQAENRVLERDEARVVATFYPGQLRTGRAS